MSGAPVCVHVVPPLVVTQTPRLVAEPPMPAAIEAYTVLASKIPRSILPMDWLVGCVKSDIAALLRGTAIRVYGLVDPISDSAADTAQRAPDGCICGRSVRKSHKRPRASHQEAAPRRSSVIGAVDSSRRFAEASHQSWNLRTHQNKIRVRRIHRNIADARPTVAEESELQVRDVERPDEGTCRAGNGASLCPCHSVVHGLEHACAVIHIKAGGCLLARSCVNRCRRACRESKRSHRQRRVRISNRSPGCSRIDRAPDTALRAANQYRVSRGIARVHGNGRDSPTDRAEESSRCWRWPKRRPI